MKVGTTLLFGFLVIVVEALENLKMVFSVAERIKIATFYMTLLQELFGNRIISRRSGFPWAPHSPDLSPLDFFLWGYVNTMCVQKDTIQFFS